MVLLAVPYDFYCTTYGAASVILFYQYSQQLQHTLHSSQNAQEPILNLNIDSISRTSTLTLMCTRFSTPLPKTTKSPRILPQCFNFQCSAPCLCDISHHDSSSDDVWEYFPSPTSTGQQPYKTPADNLSTCFLRHPAYMRVETESLLSSLPSFPSPTSQKSCHFCGHSSDCSSAGMCVMV